ncbi:uncharacterized protein LOC132903512 [Amyelois transitella]|uniref:uncharacterized protein LOC132903512 n=1 Tax=Amyelois transitella TaxID=680683 RepID=UPI00298F5FFC|nr:uncharacterized protein LOC132903512 [Amyelois transitella]
MYEVSCVAGNKVDAAYAVKSLSNVVPPGMGHTVSVQRHNAHSQSYKHKNELPIPPPVSKPDAIKSHVMRLLKRSKSHTPATRLEDHQPDPRVERRTVFARPVTDEQRRRRSTMDRRRADKRVVVTIVDGLPVVVTGQNQHNPPPVTHHRHSHRDKIPPSRSPTDSTTVLNQNLLVYCC